MTEINIKRNKENGLKKDFSTKSDKDTVVKSRGFSVN